MRKASLISSVFFILSFGAPTALADTITLKESDLNIDGLISGGLTGTGVDASAFDLITGLGSLVITFSTPGSHYLAAFFDHDIDETINTYFNEYGLQSGALGDGQSWEIDEPGWVYGDIYGHFAAGSLTDTNDIPSGGPEDVSMAMGWNFTLSPGEIARITFLLSRVAPVGRFYLQQTDPETGPGTEVSIYFSGDLTISGETPKQVPEPGTAQLLCSGLFALIVFAGTRRR